MKNIWEFLNGNKTTFGMVLVLVAQGLKVFAPGLITPEQAAFIEQTGMILGGVGVAHKGLKSEKVQNAINKAKAYKK